MSRAGGGANTETLPPLGEIRPAHANYVRGLVAKFAVTPTHEREDLVQEILIEAHRSQHSPLEARALLFGITRHVVHRWIANHRQEQDGGAEWFREHPQEVHPSPQDEREAAERCEIVRAAIADLPAIFRDVFVLAEVDEMSMPEAAAALGIPINTGYTRLHLARARFAELVRKLLARRHLERGDL